MADQITNQLKSIETQMEELNHYGFIATIKKDGTDGHFFIMGNSYRLSQFIASLCRKYPDLKEVIEDALELSEE
jgi:hypothetical protein